MKKTHATFERSALLKCPGLLREGYVPMHFSLSFYQLWMLLSIPGNDLTIKAFNFHPTHRKYITMTLTMPQDRLKILAMGRHPGNVKLKIYGPSWIQLWHKEYISARSEERRV